MFCLKCGYKLSGEENFCPVCGATIVTNLASSGVNASKDNTEQTVKIKPSNNKEPDSPKKKNSIALFALAFIVVLLLTVGVVGTIFFLNRKSNSQVNKPSEKDKQLEETSATTESETMSKGNQSSDEMEGEEVVKDNNPKIEKAVDIASQYSGYSYVGNREVERLVRISSDSIEGYSYLFDPMVDNGFLFASRLDFDNDGDDEVLVGTLDLKNGEQFVTLRMLEFQRDSWEETASFEIGGEDDNNNDDIYRINMNLILPSPDRHYFFLVPGDDGYDIYRESYGFATLDSEMLYWSLSKWKYDGNDFQVGLRDLGGENGLHFTVENYRMGVGACAIQSLDESILSEEVPLFGLDTNYADEVHNMIQCFQSMGMNIKTGLAEDALYRQVEEAIPLCSIETDMTASWWDLWNWENSNSNEAFSGVRTLLIDNTSEDKWQAGSEFKEYSPIYARRIEGEPKRILHYEGAGDNKQYLGATDYAYDEGVIVNSVWNSVEGGRNEQEYEYDKYKRLVKSRGKWGSGDNTRQEHNEYYYSYNGRLGHVRWVRDIRNSPHDETKSPQETVEYYDETKVKEYDDDGILVDERYACVQVSQFYGKEIDHAYRCKEQCSNDGFPTEFIALDVIGDYAGGAKHILEYDGDDGHQRVSKFTITWEDYLVEYYYVYYYETGTGRVQEVICRKESNDSEEVTYYTDDIEY